MNEFDKYRSSFKEIEALLKNTHYDDVHRQISLVAITTHVPIVAVYYFAIEILGHNPEFDEKIKRLREYYHI